MSRQLLERCLEAAVSRGVDVAAPYRPWLPVDLMQTLLVDVHEAVGCSWLVAIIVACLGIRVVTLPMSIASLRGAAEKALIQPQFTELVERQKALTQEGDQAKAQEVAKQLQAFQEKHGKFWMLKGTSNLLLFQMPLYLTAFWSMRGFASHPDLFPGFAMEAPLWLDSLALPDPYAGLPLLTAAIMLTNTELFGSIDTEVGAISSAAQQQQAAAPGGAASSGQGTMQKYQKWIMRGSAVLFVPITWNFPSGVFVFMATNLIAGSVQKQVLRLPVLERLLEIPPPPDRSAAGAAAAARGPPALLPLGHLLRSQLRQQGWNGALEAPKSDSRYGLRGEGQRLLAGSVGLKAALEEPSAGGGGGPGQTQQADVKVSPRFAVTKVRPAAVAALRP